MSPSNASLFLVLGFATAFAGAQTAITSTYPAVGGFQGLNTSSTGTWIMTADDSEHNIVTTVGNPLFPAGSVRIGNNGVVVAGATTGDVSFLNASIPTTGFPVGIPAGVAAIVPFWDDLTPIDTNDQDIWWKEDAGVLHILWYQTLCCPGDVFATISFEVRVYGTPATGAPWIQIVYYDTVFSHPPFLIPAFSTPCDNGGCATVGYLSNTVIANNVQWSFNAQAVTGLMVLSIFRDMVLTPSSPLGSGSLALDFSAGPPNGSYFLAVTLAPGLFPNGWLYGLDIPYAELVSEFMTGPPFTGALDSAGHASIGPIQGVPPVTLYAVGLGFLPSAPVPVLRTLPVSYSVP